MSQPSQQAILLIEDEEQQRETLTMMFESEGYNVKGAASAEIALDLLRQSKPDLIVSDVKLEGLDGISFFEEVRKKKEFQDVPFIFITGYNDHKAIEHVRSLGAAGYVTKPYDLEDLMLQVKRTLPITNPE